MLVSPKVGLRIRGGFKRSLACQQREGRAMANKKKFRKYLEVLEKLRVRQLDVYRYKDKDVLRLLVKGKVVLVELPRHREELSVEEFEKIIRGAIGG